MKISYLIIPLFLLISCTQNQKKDAKLVISEEKMIDILFDVQLSEAYLANNRDLGEGENKSLSAKYYKDIFEKHQISRQQFDESLKFYQNNLPKLRILYDSVAKRIEYLKEQNKSN
ncbi:MAG: DUF4296 domain-containing protein [Bacteroidetes bacterium]|nr:DUF4296 domain-containing protein [Bacteroidota bacterium]